MPGQEGREAVCRWDEGPASCDFLRLFWDCGDAHYEYIDTYVYICFILKTYDIYNVCQDCTNIDQWFSCSEPTAFFKSMPLAGLGVCRIRLKRLKDMRIRGWSRRTEKIASWWAFASNIRCSTRIYKNIFLRQGSSFCFDTLYSRFCFLWETDGEWSKTACVENQKFVQMLSYSIFHMPLLSMIMDHLQTTQLDSRER